ncbi:transmembrane protein [Cystoisospora suis]|uniref:Transmembrane protein n=1 Tax=Cystoisospora suis TaxID=483139 RepID=A0A2C6KJH2_9APIC|nr:transmembrane protein [Cystoisospora suis]
MRRRHQTLVSISLPLPFFPSLLCLYLSLDRSICLSNLAISSFFISSFSFSLYQPLCSLLSIYLGILSQSSYAFTLKLFISFIIFFSSTEIPLLISSSLRCFSCPFLLLSTSEVCKPFLLFIFLSERLSLSFSFFLFTYLSFFLFLSLSNLLFLLSSTTMGQSKLPGELPSQSLHRHEKEKEEEKEKERSDDASSSPSSSSASTLSDGDFFHGSSRVSGVHTPQPATANHRRPIKDEYAEEEEENNFSRHERTDKPREEDSSSTFSSLRSRRRREKERKRKAEEEDENPGENLSWSEAVDLLFGTDPRKIWRLLNYSIIGLFFVSFFFLYFSSSSDKDRDLFLLFTGFLILLLLFAIVLNWTLHQALQKPAAPSALPPSVTTPPVLSSSSFSLADKEEEEKKKGR